MQRQLTTATPVVLLADKSNFRAWGLSVQLLALTNGCQDVFRARPPARSSWLTAMAPSKALREVPPVTDFMDSSRRFDATHPDMVKAWGLLDIAVQMLSVYPAHLRRVAVIVKKRIARLRAGATAGAKRPRADPSPNDADYDDEDANIIAIAADEDDIDRARGADIALPEFDAIAIEDAVRLEGPSSSSRSGSLSGAPSMVENPMFAAPPASPAVTRASAFAAALAAASAGGVQRPGSAPGRLSPGAASSGGASSAVGATLERRAAGPSGMDPPKYFDLNERVAESESIPYLRMFRPPARLYPAWDLQGMIEMVEDLGIAFEPGHNGRNPRNVDERFFAEACRIAIHMIDNFAQPLGRYILRASPRDPHSSVPRTPPSSPSRTAGPDSVLSTRFLTSQQKEEYMRGMLLNNMHASLHREFLSYDTAQQMLDVLEDWYLDSLRKSIPAMKAQLLALAMVPGEDMRVYLMRGRELCGKLAEAGCISSEHEDMMSMLRGVTEYKYQLALSQLGGTDNLQFWVTLDLFTKNTNWMSNFSLPPSKPSIPGLAAPASHSQVPPGASGGTVCSYCHIAGLAQDALPAAKFPG